MHLQPPSPESTLPVRVLLLGGVDGRADNRLRAGSSLTLDIVSVCFDGNLSDALHVLHSVPEDPPAYPLPAPFPPPTPPSGASPA
jgi:hypothetical protein